MIGFITENNWSEIEGVFPGIYSFYQKIRGAKPNTFLNLAWLFINRFKSTSLGTPVEGVKAYQTKKNFRPNLSIRTTYRTQKPITQEQSLDRHA